MADNKTKLVSGKVQYKGDFEITKIYEFVKDLLEEKNYYITEEKNIMEPLTRTEVIRVEWDATKKVTDYFKARLGVKFLVDPSESVKKNGEKIVKGSFSISVSGVLISGYKGDYSNASAFRVFWRAVYDKFVIKDRREHVEKIIKDDVDEVLTQVRAFLGMER